MGNLKKWWCKLRHRVHWQFIKTRNGLAVTFDDYRCTICGTAHPSAYIKKRPGI